MDVIYIYRDIDIDKDIDIDIDIMCMWQPVGMFSVGQHHSRNKGPPAPWFRTAPPTRKHLAGFVFVFPATFSQQAIGVIPTCWNQNPSEACHFGITKYWILEPPKFGTSKYLREIWLSWFLQSKWPIFWGYPPEIRRHPVGKKMLKKMLYNVQGKNVSAYIPHF